MTIFWKKLDEILKEIWRNRHYVFLQKISCAFGGVWPHVIMVKNPHFLMLGLFFGDVFLQLLQHAAIIFAVYCHFGGGGHIIPVKHFTMFEKCYQHNFSILFCLSDNFLSRWGCGLPCGTLQLKCNQRLSQRGCGLPCGTLLLECNR